jgi:diguanylate cyclase (GGDEF)-like protein
MRLECCMRADETASALSPASPMMGLSVRAKILLTLVLVAVVMGGILTLVWYGKGEIDRVNRRMVEEHLQAVSVIKELELAVMTQDHAVSRYLLSGDPGWLEIGDAERSRITQALLRAHALSDSRGELEVLTELEKLLGRHRRRMDDVLRAHSAGGIDGPHANLLRRENGLLPEILRQSESLLSIHQGLLERNQAEAQRVASRYRTLEYATLGLALLATLSVGFVLRSTVLAPIRSLAEGARQFGRGQLEHRVPVHGDDELGRLSRTFNEMAAALQRERGRLTEMSMTDELTRLKNFRHFAARLEEEIRRAERYGHHLGLVLFDIDHFKIYNDTHGHPSGNEVLRVIGRLLRDNARQTDLLARYGGEEFVAILPETTKSDAVQLAEKFCRLIELHKFPGEEQQPGGRLTVSGGVAAVPEDLAHSPLLLDAADRALYAAKAAGRNRVVAYSSEMGLPRRDHTVRLRPT